MTELSDELLVAYVDGQLARKQTRAVEKVLDQDDVIARRAHALRDAHARLEAAFDAILAGDEAEISIYAGPPMAPEPAPRQRGFLKFALAGTGIAIALGLIVAGYGWPLAMPEFPMFKSGSPTQQTALAAPWRREAARAQAFASRASLEVSPESQANRDLVTLQFASAIAPTLKFPDLQPQGFRFVRAQLLRDGNEPLGLMLYLPKEGAPLALYARRGQVEALPVFQREGNIGAVGWSEAGVSYLLAGEQDDDMLLRLTEKIRHEPLPPAPSLPPFVPVATDKARIGPLPHSPRPTKALSRWNPNVPSPIR